MKWRRLAIAAAIGVAAPASAGPVDDLGWLGGSWLAESADGWTEEQWMAPRGGVMLGTNRSGKGDKATWFEFMRIAEDANGVLSFWGLPAGKQAAPFRLTSSKAGEAVFENPAHDFPTRIHYKLQGQRLLATVSGPGGANAQSWSFRRPSMRERRPVRPGR